MKVKITDLMRLYEDERCSLSPTEEQNERAADPGARREKTGEVNEVKQSKHRFGWKEGLSLAAALAVVILAGFGVKRLIERGAAPVTPGVNDVTRQTESGLPDTEDWQALEGGEQEAVSSFLSFFAMQQIENVPEDLSDDGSLIHLAFLWRRNNDPESLTIREGLPGLALPDEGLTPEQVNETLSRLLGKTVTPPEDGAETDYSPQIGTQPITVFSAGWFWDSPGEKDASFFFALATEGRSGAEAGQKIVRFRVYYINYERWGEIDLGAMHALSTAEAETLEAEKKLILTATGEAKLERIEDGYRLLSYAAEPLPPSTEPDEPKQDSEEDLHTEPTGFDPVAAEDWRQFNGLLTEAARMGFPALNSDGTFASTQEWDEDRFALATALISQEDSTLYELAFEVYQADPLLWPDYPDIDPAGIEDLGELLEEDAVTVIGGGTAVFERHSDGFRLKDYSFEDPQTGHPDPDEDPALRAEIEALFSDLGSWYSRALSSFYADPADVDLFELFYDGIPGAGWASKEELRELYGEDVFDEDGNVMGPSTDKLPRQDMDRVLLQYFGLSLEQTAKRGLDQFYYREDTDSYYHCHGDTNIEPRTVAAVRRLEDGTVLCTYKDGFWNGLTDNSFPALHTAGLRPVGSGAYQILFNLPGKWITAEDLGELRALFRLSGSIKAETRDADGTETVRELIFGRNGELSYREGDPDSEYSYWSWGKWWLEDDHSFCCAMCRSKEDGNRIGPWRTLSFRCSLTEDSLVLVQESENGFHDDAPGTELRFAPVTE